MIAIGVTCSVLTVLVVLMGASMKYERRLTDKFHGPILEDEEDEYYV